MVDRPPPQILADMLTRSWGEGKIMPTIILLAPEDLRPSYGPEVKGNITRHFLQYLIIELSQRCYTMELNYFRIIFEVALCKFDYQQRVKRREEYCCLWRAEL